MTMCDDCGGSCCSFNLMAISLRDSPKDGDLKRDLHKNPPFDLHRPSGKPPPMRFYTAAYKEKPEEGRFIVFECQAFDPTTRKCGIYADRPLMCREFTCPPLRGETRLGDYLRKTRAQPLIRKRDVTETVLDSLTLSTVPEAAFR